MFNIFGSRKKKIEEVTEDFLAHLKTTDNIRALQDGQKELADAIVRINERLSAIEAELVRAKSDAVLEAVKEAQAIASSVNASVFERFTQIEVGMDRIARGARNITAVVELPPNDNSQP